MSLISFSREQFLSLSLFSWPWHFWRLQASYSVECPSVWLSLSDVSSWSYPSCAPQAGISQKRCCSHCIPSCCVGFQGAPSVMILITITFYAVFARLLHCKVTFFFPFVGRYFEALWILCSWSTVHFLSCLSVRNHGFLFYSMSYNPLLSSFILRFKVSQIWLVVVEMVSFQFGFCVFLTCHYHFLSLPYFLAQHDVLGSSCTFPA